MASPKHCPLQSLSRFLPSQIKQSSVIPVQESSWSVQLNTKPSSSISLQEENDDSGLPNPSPSLSIQYIFGWVPSQSHDPSG